MLLSQDQLVAIPTETVYGLAANAYSQDAIARVFAVKQRPLSNPLIVHMKDIEQVQAHVAGLPYLAAKLLERFAPGPLTVILPKRSSIPHLVTAGLDDVAIRIPAHPATMALLRLLRFPIAAPSANRFMKISPTRPEHVYQQLSGSIPYILDGGYCKRGLESTVVKIEDNTVKICRLGAISLEQLKSVHPKTELQKDTGRVCSPGMMAKHYAPQTVTVFMERFDEVPPEYNNSRVALITFSGDSGFKDGVYSRGTAATPHRLAQ